MQASQIISPEIHPATRNGWTGVATADFYAPQHLGTTCWKSFNDAGLSPNAVTLRFQPLRPVVGLKNA